MYCEVVKASRDAFLQWQNNFSRFDYNTVIEINLKSIQEINYHYLHDDRYLRGVVRRFVYL